MVDKISMRDNKCKEWKIHNLDSKVLLPIFLLSKIQFLVNFTLHSIPGHALEGIYEYLTFYR